MQFVHRGNKVQVYKYDGFDKEKKRSRLKFLGSMAKDDLKGWVYEWKLEKAIKELDEKDKQEIKEKLTQLRRDAFLSPLPWQILQSAVFMQKMDHEEMAALLRSKTDDEQTWEESLVFALYLMSKQIANHSTDEKRREFFARVRDAHDIVFRKTD